VISNFNDNTQQQARPQSADFNDGIPAMPPAESYAQRPTAPAPRPPATRRSENIYADAGSAASSSSSNSNYPTPSAAVPSEPVAPLPTPAAEFERRIAENPIVPAGAFGGSQPTARFFSPSSNNSASSSTTQGGGGGYSSTSQSSFPPEEDSKSKWQKLDDNEKKRVAADAYKAFEKSLEGSRQAKPKSSIGDIAKGGTGRKPISTGGGGGGSDRENKKPTTADAKNQSQMELERKKHQQMVNEAASKEKKEEVSDENIRSPPLPTTSTPKRNTVPPKQPQKSAQQIQASAAQASAKRMVSLQSDVCFQYYELHIVLNILCFTSTINIYHCSLLQNGQVSSRQMVHYV